MPGQLHPHQALGSHAPFPSHVGHPAIVIDQTMQNAAFTGCPTVVTTGLSGGWHAFHILLTFFTVGFWLPIYLIHLIGAHRSVVVR